MVFNTQYVKERTKRKSKKDNGADFIREMYNTGLRKIIDGKQFQDLNGKLFAIKYKLRCGNYDPGDLAYVSQKIREINDDAVLDRKKEILADLGFARIKHTSVEGIISGHGNNRNKLNILMYKVRNYDVDEAGLRVLGSFARYVYDNHSEGNEKLKNNCNIAVRLVEEKLSKKKRQSKPRLFERIFNPFKRLLSFQPAYS